MPHKRLVRELLIQNLVEKGRDFRAIHRLVKIGRHRRKVNSLAKVVVTPLLEALQENRHALLGGRPPIVINEAPEIIRQRIFLAEIDVDHRQHRPLAFVKARQEKWYDGLFDIISIEIGGNGCAKTLDGGEDLLRKQRLCGVGGGLVVRPQPLRLVAALPSRPTAATPPLRTVRRSTIFRFHYFAPVSRRLRSNVPSKLAVI